MKRWVIGRYGPITRSRGADHVLEFVGGENIVRSVEAVSVGGRISLIGPLGGTELRAPTTPMLLDAPVARGIVSGHRRAMEVVVRRRSHRARAGRRRSLRFRRVKGRVA